MELQKINRSLAFELVNETKSAEWLAEDDYIYDVPLGLVILLSFFYGTISLLAVIGNSLVIWIVVTTRTMQTVTNWYIANLAMADVIIGAFAIPFQFQAALLQRWNLPHFMCQFCPFVQQVSVSVSVLTLTAIAIDRHRAIINPLRARQSKYVSRVIIFFIWTVALVLASPMLLMLGVVDNEYVTIREGEYYYARFWFCDRVNFSTEDLMIYKFVFVFVQFLVPFCVISFVYIQMAVKLWGSKTPGNAQNERDQALLRNKKKVVKMLVIVVILFCVCWLPLQTYHIIEVSWSHINNYHYINIIWFVCDWLAMSNSCYNPFIYGIYNEKFKREFLRRCPFCRFGSSDAASEYNNESKSMYTRATSIRSNFANASLRNNHHINQNYNHHAHHSGLTGAAQLNHTTNNNQNNSYYFSLSSAQNGNNNSSSLTVATGGGGGINGNGKRYSGGSGGGGVDLELKPTTSIKDSTRKIVFQPVRTASLKNNHSAQNGPLLSSSSSSSASASHQQPSKNDGLYPDMDLSEQPLLARMGAGGQESPLLVNGNAATNGGGGDGDKSHHVCQSGVCLNENCPGIMFEDVDL